MIHTPPPVNILESYYPRDLLQMIQSGRIQFPDFKDLTTPKNGETLELLNSIHSGFPIGAICLWESNQNLKVQNQIGPMTIPNPEAETYLYVLDGLKRLSILVSALRLPKNEIAQATVQYDLKKEHFVTGSSSNKPHHMPMTLFSHPILFRQFIANLDDEMTNRAIAVMDAFSKYTLPVIRVKGASLESALLIYARLNKEQIDPTSIISRLTDLKPE